MASSVTAPRGRQFGQIPGLKQMLSSSSGGASGITLQFDLIIPLDVAEQGVQAAITAGSNLLPQDLPAPPVYSKVNPADAPILTLGLSSRTLTLPQIQNLADTRLAQKRSEEHTSELQSRLHLVCRLLLEKKKKNNTHCPRINE